MSDEIICPIDGEKIPVDQFADHLEQVHNISGLSGGGSFKTARRYISPELITTTDWGEPFDNVERKDKQPISDDWYESPHNTTEPHLGEIHQRFTDEHGEPVRITKQREVIRKTRDSLEENGVRPQYIRVEGSRVIAQYEASPVAWGIIALIILAVVVVIILAELYMIMEAVYEVFIEPLPDWMEPVIIGALLLGGGYLTLKAFQIISPGEPTERGRPWRG